MGNNQVSKNELIPLFQEYIQECEFSARLKPATIRGYKAVFNLLLTITPEITTTEFLQPSLLSEFFKRLTTRKRIVGVDTEKQGVTDSTVKTYWNKLNSFFEWLLQKKYISHNPLHSIKKPPDPVYEDSRALSDDEVNKILAAIISRASTPAVMRRDIVIVNLLYYCGLRRNELINLQVKDIDLFGCTITVRGETSKSKKKRELPIHPTLLLHLREYMAERTRLKYQTEYLLISFSCTNARLTKDGLRHWEKRFNNLSGVKFHLHRFRHSFATNLAKKDVGIVKIQKLLGHSTTAMTERYVRSIIPADLRDDISKL